MSDRVLTAADLPSLRAETDRARIAFERATKAREEARSAWYQAEDLLHDTLDRLSVCAAWGCDRDRDEEGFLCPDCRMSAEAKPEQN